MRPKGVPGGFQNRSLAKVGAKRVQNSYPEALKIPKRGRETLRLRLSLGRAGASPRTRSRTRF